MKRLLLPLLTIAAGVWASATASAAEPFPRPPGLEPDVQFWIRIYTEVDTKSGLIHDVRDLGLVYETLTLPSGLSHRAREKRVEKAKKRIKSALLELASGKRTGLSREERRVLALFPSNVSKDTLRAAAKRLRFQLGQADKFRAGLVRSGAWEPHIRKTFADMGLPAALASLPHVESSYTPTAYSHVGAAGLWQFTRSTGRRYMRVDHVVDERLDPYESTVAAARLLEQNHITTGSWPLAITAYNHGAAGMRRAKRKLGTSDIETIVRRYKSRTFGFASRNFYVEFLAAWHVDRNSEKYFGALILDAPVAYDTVELPFYAKASSLETAFGVDRAVLRGANPALRSMVWGGEKYVPKGFSVRVPRAHLARPLATGLASVPKSQRFARQTPDQTHRVRRGDTLSGIASRYGTNVRQLMALNKLRSRHRIRVGQKLRLPYTGRVPTLQSSEPPADGVHVVRRGETLTRIAARYGVSEAQIVRASRLRNKNRIFPGQRLRLGTTAAAPKAAPVEVAKAEPKVPAAVPVQPAERPRARREVAREAAAVVESAADPEAKLPEASAVALEATAPAEEEDTSELRAELSADPSDYSVTAKGTIEVQAAETLGHIAEWLDVRASRLRNLNGLRYGTPLAVHQKLELDFDRVSRDEFERRRLAYHRALQTAFFERFEIAGAKVHVVRRGDSVWVLSKRNQVPLWLLRQYNPDVDFGALHAGTKVNIPLVRPHRVEGDNPA